MAEGQNYFGMSAFYFTLDEKGSSYLSLVKDIQTFCQNKG